MKYRTLTKYVIRRHVAPFALAFVVLLILFVLDQLLHIVDAVLESGLPFLTVIAFFGYSFSWMAALAVPMAVLISVLMVFTRMSESNEIVAMKAAGIGPLRVMGGPILVGAALSLVMVWFNNEVIPDAVHRARLILTAIHRARPAITLKGREGMFIDDFPGYRLRVDRVRLDAPSPMAPYEGSRVDGVVLYELDPAGRRSPSIVTAKWGTVEIWGEGEEMRLILHQGELHRADPEDQSRYLRTSFEKQVIYVTDPKRKSDKKRVKRQSDWRNDRELSSAAMRKRVEGHEEHIRQARERIAKLNENTELGDRQKKREREHQERLIKRKQRIINAYLVEIHKKYSIATACLAFVLLGVPLGMRVRRGSTALSVTLSLFCFVMYWMALSGGEQLADRGVMVPWIAMWMANAIIGSVGLLLLFQVTSGWSIWRLLDRLPRIPWGREQDQYQQEDS